MSAFIVHPDHIKQIVIFHARQTPGQFRQDLGASIEADMLYAENHRSVNARYGEKTQPEPIIVTGRDIAYPTVTNPVAILKMIACLEYQSCETDDWETTEAAALLRRIKEQAIRALPGYDAAAWEHTGESEAKAA